MNTPAVSNGESGYLAVATIIRNEARYLPEWIEFHRLVGVEHFYLYDNGSTDVPGEVLAPYISGGVVTLLPWGFPWRASPVGGQVLAYAHALSTFGWLWRWMAFIDVDEFLFPRNDDTMIDFLQRYEDLPAVVAFWLMFGFSGQDVAHDGLVTERFTHRAPFPRLSKPKSIVQPSGVLAVSNAHLFDLTCGPRQGFTEARTLYRKQESWRGKFAIGNAISDELRLNHYYTRSRQEFEDHNRKWEQTHPKNARKRRRIAEIIEAETVRDDAILRFVPRLRERMERHQLSLASPATPT